MEARKSWYGSVESNFTATPSPKDEDVAAAAASAWAEAARGRRRAGGRAGGFLSRMELEGPWGSNRRRSSERSPRTMASAMSSAAAKASDSVDWLSDAQSAWCVVVRAEELAKDDSPESRKRDAMVLTVADGVRKYWVVLGFLQEGHIHAGGAAAGGDGGGVSWAELVVYKRELKGSPLTIGVSSDVNSDVRSSGAGASRSKPGEKEVCWGLRGG
jgi:hypothetical protein